MDGIKKRRSVKKVVGIIKSKDGLKKGGEKIRLFLGALKKFDDDNGFFLSSGITFNLLIGLIPLSLLLLAGLATYLYSDQAVFSHLSNHMEDMLPSLDPTITNNLLRIISDRKIVGILGIGGLIWTATCVFSSIRTALNIVFQVEKSQGILKGMAIDLFIIFLAGLFHLASMGLTSVVTYLHGYHFSLFLSIGPIIRFFLKYVIPFFFTFWMFFLIYKIIPNRKIQFRSALEAALFTSLLWEVTKQLFGWYVLRLGNFSMVYGSMSTLIIFVLWVYYSSAILILGGEFVFLLEKKRKSLHG
jgi:membrane protein